MKKFMAKVIVVALAISLFLLPGTGIGAADMPDGSNTESFEYDGAEYRVLSKTKKTVMLVKAKPLQEYDGKRFVQEGNVYRGDEEYTVVSIGYKAFCEDGSEIRYELKLPRTINTLHSECFGANITKVNMRNTKIKTLPAYLFVTYEGLKSIVAQVKNIKLPKNLETISGKAFSGCERLKSLTVPESVKKLGYYAIEKTCKKLIFEGKLPKGIENQKMKDTEIYVKPEYYLDSLDILIKQISLGKCKVYERYTS